MSTTKRFVDEYSEMLKHFATLTSREEKMEALRNMFDFFCDHAELIQLHPKFLNIIYAKLQEFAEQDVFSITESKEIEDILFPTMDMEAEE